MPEGLIVLDADGRIMFCNPVVEELLGAEGSEVRGKSLEAIMRRREADFEPPEKALHLADLIKAGEVNATLELAVVNPTRHDLSIPLFPIDASPTEPMTGLLLRDVTEERDLQRRRDAFVSVASHELRTPMTTVMGFTELLMSRDADEEQQVQWLDHVYEDSRRVITIVDELLNVSRIQSGNVSVELLAVDIKPLLVRASESHMTVTEARSIVVDVPDSLPTAVADADKLAQVVDNLVSNALKYSPSGGTTRTSARHERKLGRIVVSVADEGIGIAEEDQEHLFTTFQRIYRTETQGVRGTGLGLYIVKGLLELMHGTVWVESRLNEGSVFRFALPTGGRK